MKSDLLEHASVQAWRSQHPREWWAFQKLEDDDDLRTRVLAAILGERPGDEAIDDLVRFAEGLEARQKAERDGTVRAPPGDGERRSLDVKVSRMTQKVREGRKFFRVDFTTSHGWAGFFDTTNPHVVERIAKHRDRSRPITVVGEVTRRPYEFLVELGNRVKIV